MALQDEPWWDEFIQRLSDESLADLASIFLADELELLDALAEEDLDLPLEERAWWPQVLRDIADGRGLRRTARRFGVEADDLRDALDAVGVEVVEGDASELLPYRDLLGHVPDREIAERAGVPLALVTQERERVQLETGLTGASATTFRPPRTRRADAVAQELVVVRRPLGKSSHRDDGVVKTRPLGASLPLPSEPKPLAGIEALPGRDALRRGVRRIVRPDRGREEEAAAEGTRRRPPRGEARHSAVRVLSKAEVSDVRPAPEVVPTQEAAPRVEPAPVATQPSPVSAGDIAWAVSIGDEAFVLVAPDLQSALARLRELRPDEMAEASIRRFSVLR